MQSLDEDKASSFASSLFQANLHKSNDEFSERLVMYTANLVIFHYRYRSDVYYWS